MRYFLFLILSLIAVESFPQREVSGVISEIDGESFTGVVILEVGTDHFTISDTDGKFQLITLSDTCFLSFSYIGYTTKTVRITQDTVIHIILRYDRYDTKWLSLGANYDVVNSLFGLTFSNGYDEMPLIHFEDFSDKVIYKMNFQSNYCRNYSIGANLGWKYPNILHIRRLSQLSIGYRLYRNPLINLRHHDFHVSAAILLKNTELTLKTGYQFLNDNNNWGASVVLQKPLVYERLLVGLSAGYYFDYFTYSLYFQGLFISKNLSFRLAYDRIDTYNFLNIGLNYCFIIR